MPTLETDLAFYFSPFTNLEFTENALVLAFGFEGQEDPDLAKNFPELEQRRKQIDKIDRRGDEVVSFQSIKNGDGFFHAGLIHIGYPWKKRKEIIVGSINFLQLVFARMVAATTKARSEGFEKIFVILPNRFSPSNVKDEITRHHLYSFVKAISEAIVYSNNDERFVTKKMIRIKETVLFFWGEPNLTVDAFMRKAIGDGSNMGKQLSFARSLIETPPNLQTPIGFLNEALSLNLEDKPSNKWRRNKISPNVTAYILNGTESIVSKGFGLIGAVGSGAAHEPCILKLHYKPSTKRTKRIKKLVFTAKGVVFDTGYYDNMHYDMAGAATVISLLRLAEEYKLPVEIIAIIPVVQNMIGPKAYLPGSIFKAWNGKTVEIVNTDCEGRLLMADALSFGEKTFRPDAMVTVATLGDPDDFAPDFLKVGFFGKGNEKKIKVAEKNAAEKVFCLPSIDFLNHVDQQHVGSRSDLINDVYKRYHTSAFVFMYNFFEYETPWIFVDNGAVFASDAIEYASGPGFGLKFLWYIV